MAEKSELLQGTLDLLILRVLNGGALHGFGIAQKIHLLSNQSLQLQEGSLYPALYRMERKGWIKAEWGISDQNRKAKFYALTNAGRKQLQTEQDAWKRIATAIGAVLRGAD